jgi:hypothetical protein
MTGFGYSAVTANAAKQAAAIVSERLEVYQAEQASQQNRIIKLLEDQEKLLKKIEAKP